MGATTSGTAIGVELVDVRRGQLPTAQPQTRQQVRPDDVLASPATGSGIHVGEPPGAQRLERRGQLWILWSFLLCPCHVPLSLGVLGAVLAGTSLGAVLHDHSWVAVVLITAAWVAGTGYGFHLIRRAQRANGVCPVAEAMTPNTMAAETGV